MAEVKFALGAVAIVDKWVEHASRTGKNLCCSNPKCVHLVAHIVGEDDNVTFKDLDCTTTVDVTVNGKEEKRYRFAADDTIHIGSRSTGNQSTNKLDNESAQIVCGECMIVGAHVGRGGVCRASAAEAPDGTDISTLPRAEVHGPRITALENHNANSYNEADVIDQLREEALSNANANPNRGGAEVQRALLDDRKAELTKSTETAAAAKKAHSKAKKVLAHLEAGYDKNNKPQQDLEITEDDEAADKFFNENGRHVGTLREHFPQCALYWYGAPPTEEAITDGKALVDSTLAELKDAEEAKDAAALAVEEAEAMLAELGQDYDDAAAADANAANNNQRGRPKKGGPKYKGKKYEDLNEDEKRIVDERTATSKAKRKAKAAEDKRMIENYPKAYKKAMKYQRAVEEKKIANETLLFQERVQEDWLGARKGKPNGWDPEAMVADFQKYCRKRRRQEDERQEEEKKQALEQPPQEAEAEADAEAEGEGEGEAEAEGEGEGEGEGEDEMED